ncbi:MAG: E3 binding domain-containing protein, partial [Actinomycetota bacterium]|nr:E3 binding domain-containing protein [Actinomycetota bacterium]
MADVTLPQLGETVTEGTITQWFKAVGDSVVADEPLFEVSTDKVDTEVPSPVAGVLTEIRVPEGETVDVGTVIAVVGDAEGASADAGEPAAEPTPAEPEAPAEAAETSEEPAVTDSDPPAEEPAAETGPAPEPEPAGAETQAAPAEEVAPEPAPEPAAPSPAPADDAAAPPSATAGILLSPVVRRLVNEHGLDPSSIAGTGAGGRITRVDVLAHIDGIASGKAAAPVPDAAAPPIPAPAPAAAPASAPAAPAAAPQAAPAPTPGARDEAIKLSKIRKLTGSAMIASKTTSPHAFSVVEVDYHN